MSYILEAEGEKLTVDLGGDRTLAEILTEDQYKKIKNGVLVAISANGGIMNLSSPLATPDKQGPIKLLPADSTEVQEIVKKTFGEK